jgi:hypothetical protein
MSLGVILVVALGVKSNYNDIKNTEIGGFMEFGIRGSRRILGN